MTVLTEAYIDSFALNAGAIKNGNDLVRKNSFQKLCRTEDETLLFGQCKGSGKEPYSCSADFIKPELPVFRCSCPSRQFPCKHILGLMYAFAAGKPFTVEDTPADITEKREKADKREEKKKEASETTEPKVTKRKVNKNALAKKRVVQLEGVELLEKLIRQMVHTGLAALDERSLRMYEDQANQLGNHYVVGLQASFRALLLLLRSEEKKEMVYTEALEQLTALHSLLKRSRDYLSARIQDPSLPMDSTSVLEEKIGHAWQLSELREFDRIAQNIELLQLSFRSYTDEARGEHVDEGHFIQLNNGEIVVTRNYRPFRAAKYIKEEDTCHLVIQTKELAVYPGDLNTRVRWEEMTMRDSTASDREITRSFAERSYAAAVKKVKNQLKNPLADKHPIMLLHAAQVAKSEDGYALEDEQGNRIMLADIRMLDHPSLQLLPYLDRSLLVDTAVLVMFEDDLSTGRLTAQPLALFTENETIRLLY